MMMDPGVSTKSFRKELPLRLASKLEFKLQAKVPNKTKWDREGFTGHVGRL